ncbi:MAG: serine/threonine-protein kinase [Polyangiales bacterium]
MSLGGPELLGGRYELVRVIGVGGMGTVHLGRMHGDRGFLRHVAIKRLRPHIATKDAVEMLVEEARVASDLQHPNVVQMLDVGNDARGGVFLVMEWVDGIDLGHFVRGLVRSESRVEWPEGAYVAMSVLDALAAAHERRDANGTPSPVFHRDVTPSNVLLSKHGQVKLADFGLARAMDRETVTRPGVVKGKLAYVAPEMVAGIRANPCTDVFSVGVLLWETLAGRRLYDTTNELELFVKVGAARIPGIRTIRPDVPEKLEAIVARATAKRVDDRYQSAGAMAEDLAALLDEAPVRMSARRLAPRIRAAMEEAAAT